MQPKLESMLLCSDLHAPYHDKRAWELFLQVGKWLKPHHAVLNGDAADCYQISSYPKDPARKLRFKEEIDIVNECLDDFNDLKAAHYVFAAGNHDWRTTSYIANKAPELYGFVDIPTLFKLNERAWDYIPYRQEGYIGKLCITHDVGNSGRNAVFKALDLYEGSTFTGHTHRLSYVVEATANGKSRLSTSLGWLGDINQVDYLHRAIARKNWSLGFGVGHMNPATGVAYITPVPIIEVDDKYTCMVWGKYFEV